MNETEPILASFSPFFGVRRPGFVKMRPYFSKWEVYSDGDCTARYGHVWTDERGGGQVSGCGGLGRKIKRDFGSGGITYGMKENTPVSGPNFPFFPIRQPGFTKMQPCFSILAIILDGIARPCMSTFCLRKRWGAGYQVVGGPARNRGPVLGIVGSIIRSAKRSPYQAQIPCFSAPAGQVLRECGHVSAF